MSLGAVGEKKHRSVQKTRLGTKMCALQFSLSGAFETIFGAHPHRS